MDRVKRLLLATLLVVFPELAPDALAQAAPVPQPTATAADDLNRLVDEVAAEVEKLRGWTFKRRVKRQRTSLEQARRDLRRDLEKAVPSDRRDVMSVFLTTAGFLPPGHDFSKTVLSLLEQQVAGYYEPETETLHIVDRQGSMPDFIERMVLAHELTHALDDQYGDLRTLTEKAADRTEDMDLVVTSLAEGSATALMLQQVMRAQAAGRVDAGQLMRYVAQEMERAKVFDQLPRYFSAMFGSYIIGAAFLAAGDAGGVLAMPDNRVIGERFLSARRSLPRSSEQVLHPQKYWDPSSKDEPVVLDDGAVERWLRQPATAGAPGRWIVYRDTLGELLTALLTQPRDAVQGLTQLQAATAWTNAGATGWGGDRFYLLAAGGTIEEARRSLKDPRGVWISAWDTPADRDEFAAALEKGSPPAGYSLSPLGQTGAVVFLGFAKAERDALLTRLPDFEDLLATRR